jgi:hypothetical protein
MRTSAHATLEVAIRILLPGFRRIEHFATLLRIEQCRYWYSLKIKGLLGDVPEIANA